MGACPPGTPMSAASDPNALPSLPLQLPAGLQQTHHALRTMLERLNQLTSDIADAGLTPEVREEAAALHAWFTQEPAQHHAEEEEHVFPRLLASGDADLVHLARRLIADHGWLDVNWKQIAPSLLAAKDNYQWFQPAELIAAVRLFTRMHEEHMELEETQAFPAASTLQQEAPEQ